MSTLWLIDDESTAALMKGFYAAHEQRPLSRADALRDAQLAVMGGARDTGTARGATLLSPGPAAGSARRWAHPYYWASFVLRGDWR